MFKTTKEAEAFADAFKSIELKAGIRTAICAPFTQLAALKAAFEGTAVGVGAQNVHFKDEGAFTGEISVPMLNELGLDYCIIGHSERREYFAETDETVNLKLKKLFADSEITPILCVGENLAQRELNKEQYIVAGQLIADLEGLSASDVEKLVIAYEPIWAIGTGKTATSDQAEEVCCAIRACIRELYDEATAEAIRIQYGGSVNAGNAAELFAKPDIDGGLVGGASLKEDFGKIVNYK